MGREFSTPSPPQISICESSPFFLFIYLLSLVLYPLPSYPFSFHTLAHSWHAPKLNSFLFNGFRTLCPETPGVGVSTRSVKGFNASPPTCVFSARSSVYQLE